jgi:arylsulfate sulfotransferase
MKFQKSPVIDGAPNSSTPLVGIVTFETDELSYAEIDINDGVQSRTVSFDQAPVREHSCPILGLRPDATHYLTVRVRAGSGEITEAPDRLEFNTPSLPDDFPPIEVVTCVPEKREPGYIIFSVSFGAMNKLPEKPGFLVAMNQHGQVVWFHRDKSPIYDVRRLANGNLAYTTHDARLIEIDMLGTVHHTWYPTGKFKDGLPGGTAVETEEIHHAFWPMESGNILMLSIEQLEFDDWPASDQDPAAPRAPAKVIGDTIIEFQPDGAVVREWKLSEILDPKRICYGSFAPFWARKGYTDTYDWSHANGLTYDPKDDAILVSVRHQDAVIKFSRSTGELIWILGDHGNWKAPWSDKLLTSKGELAWQYHQHNVSITSDGGVMVFDNGSGRALPFDRPRTAPENFSRAVEYLVNEDTMTVEQAWEFDAGKDTRYYSTFVGGATLLRRTGNVFVTFGGVSYEDDGTPSDNNQLHRVMARHVEVTRDAAAEKVLELVIEDPSEADAIRYFSFRGEHVDSL